MPSSPVSVVLPDADGWDALKVLRCLGGQAGVRCYVLCKDAYSLPRYSRYCAGWAIGQEDDDVDRALANFEADVLFPVTERGIEWALRRRDALRNPPPTIPLPTLEMLGLAQDKLAFYRFAAAHALPVVESLPTSTVLESAQHEKPPNDLFPALVKPRHSAGGRGIVRVNSSPELFALLHNRSDLQNQLSDSIVQPFVEGVDICVQLMSLNGRIVAAVVQEALESDAGYFGPQRLMRFTHDEGALDLAHATVRSLQWNGLACIDMRRDAAGKYWLLEVNPRMGQALLGALLAGLNLPWLAVAAATGCSLPAYRSVPTLYAHPLAYVRHIVRRLLGRHTGQCIPWESSGLRFCVRDPLPELVSCARQLTHRYSPARQSQSGRTADECSFRAK